MVKDQEKSELTDLIKWKFQNGTFYWLTLYQFPILIYIQNPQSSIKNPSHPQYQSPSQIPISNVNP